MMRLDIAEVARLIAETDAARQLASSAIEQQRAAEVASEADETSDVDVDIIDRLRTNTPCLVCQQTCEDAAAEIARLRLQDGQFVVSDGDILIRLNSAIFSMDPCGREDCVSPSASFLAELRDEICRLRVIEAKAVSLSKAAQRVWRGESPVSSLIHSSISFEKARSR